MLDNKDIFYAQRLKDLRLKHGYMQKVMAGLLGCSQQEYSKLENCNKHFTKEIIKQICTAFNIKPAEFEINSKPAPASQNNEMDAELSAVLHLKLINVFDEKPQLNNIVALFKTKYMLEGQLAMLDQLIQAKKK